MNEVVYLTDQVGSSLEGTERVPVYIQTAVYVSVGSAPAHHFSFLLPLLTGWNLVKMSPKVFVLGIISLGNPCLGGGLRRFTQGEAGTIYKVNGTGVGGRE